MNEERGKIKEEREERRVAIRIAQNGIDKAIVEEKMNEGRKEGREE